MTLEARSVLGNPFIGVYRIGVPTARGVFVSELSGCCCVHCSSTVAAHEILDELSDAVGLSLPAKPGVATDNKGRWAFWMSPRSWLVSVDADREGALVASVAERFPDRRVHASRFSDYLFWMSVSGEGAEDLLRQGGFLSVEETGFQVGSMKRTPIAGIPLLVWRQAPTDWRLGLERSRASDFVDWIRACLNGNDLAVTNNV